MTHQVKQIHYFFTLYIIFFCRKMMQEKKIGNAGLESVQIDHTNRNPYIREATQKDQRFTKKEIWIDYAVPFSVNTKKTPFYNPPMELMGQIFLECFYFFYKYFWKLKLKCK